MRPTLQLHSADPSTALEVAFSRIARERMAGLPLLNPALRVQAVGFARWQQHWLGALVTPWFLNLVLVPGDAATWQRAGEGQRVFHHFGAGDFAFLGSHEPEVGEFQSCSLVSPMGQFADQASASATARAALHMLQADRPAAALMGQGGAHAGGQLAAPLAPVAQANAAPTRRAMLFGR